jgi:hypothetical protein
MFNMRLSIQFSIVVVTVFFFCGLFISFIIFCLCRFDLSKRVHIEIEKPVVSNQNNEVSMQQTRIELFEIREVSEHKNEKERIKRLSIASENIINQTNDELSQSSYCQIIENKNQIKNENINEIYEKNVQLKKKQPFRLKSQSLDLSHVNSKYMLYGKRSPIYKNYLIKSNRSFLGYEPNESSK